MAQPVQQATVVLVEDDERTRTRVAAAIRADDNSAFGRNFDRVYYPKFSASWIPIEASGSRLPLVNSLKLSAR